mmetsp:Transcript_8531/g.11256  ORF Transcript_8531/g.11256 Transcript_8531/m.11256 type:complete len:178 (-) Transcript_8531:493-1026(-)
MSADPWMSIDAVIKVDNLDKAVHISEAEATTMMTRFLAPHLRQGKNQLSSAEGMEPSTWNDVHTIALSLAATPQQKLLLRQTVSVKHEEEAVLLPIKIDVDAVVKQEDEESGSKEDMSTPEAGLKEEEFSNLPKEEKKRLKREAKEVKKEAKEAKRSTKKAKKEAKRIKKEAKSEDS